jgi:hypothetical protein
MNMHSYVFGFFLLVTFPAAGFAAQDPDPPGNSEQRDCAAVGPAAPSSVTAAATTVKSGKSNSSDRQAKSVTPPPVPAEASNLNQSKSNINREVEDESSGAVEDIDCGR